MKFLALLASLSLLLTSCMNDNSVKGTQNLVLSEQLIGLENSHNARQLGGYVIDGKKIKDGLLLRSAHLASLSPADSALLSDKYRLQRIYDFRSAKEIESSPDILPGKATSYSLSIDFTKNEDAANMPEMNQEQIIQLLLDYAELDQIQELCANLYNTIFFEQKSQDSYRLFFEDLLKQDPKNGAVLWHCTQGKDRAGVASALVLAALGADRELIIKDFALSKDYYDQKVSNIPIETEAQKTVINTLLSANPDLFERALDRIDEEYGSIINYMNECLGVTSEMINTLRNNYLE